MPTICFCNGNIPWGGGETWHLNAARSFAARSWRVLLICHPESELYARAAREPGIRVLPLRLGRLAFLNPALLARLTALFKREKPRAVIMNLPSDLKAAGPAARLAGVRHVIYRRGSALPVRDSAMNRWLFGRVITRLIVNSQATRAQALAANPRLIPEERISVLPNGLDVAAFDAALALARSAGQPAARQDGGQGGRPFIIGTAGRLNRQKAQHLLLQLGKELSDMGLDLRLLIAGTGEREAELKKLARDLGLGDKTGFTGFMHDLSPFWAHIDLFVLPSLWEGFGNVVIEAGLAEKPVFAFAVSNLPELIINGVNGRLFPLPEEERDNAPGPAAQIAMESGVPPAQPAGENDQPMAQMARAVMHLAANAEMREQMGRNGRALALRYSQEACMDALEALLV